MTIDLGCIKVVHGIITQDINLLDVYKGHAAEETDQPATRLIAMRVNVSLDGLSCRNCADR